MDKDGEKRPKPMGLVEFLFGELRAALKDIRHKVVEQGWFGRHVTPNRVMEIERSLVGERNWLQGEKELLAGKPEPEVSKDRPTFAELWGDQAERTDNRSPERGPEIER